MPFKVILHEDYVHIAWHGTICNEDLRLIGSKLPEIARELGRAPDVLHTFDEVTGSQMQPWDAFKHSLRREDTRLANRARSASVAKTHGVKTMASLFQQLNRNPSIEFEVFDNEADALAWLRQPKAQ